MWLDLSDNAEQWALLREAIKLGKDFGLFFVVVANLEIETLAVEGLRELAADLSRDLILMDARGTESEAPVRRLLTDLGEGTLAVLRTHQALSRDREGFERCFVQLNGRRDQIVAQFKGPLVVITRVDALRVLGDIAPDLFSVHAAQFHLSSSYDAGRPAWLLLQHEAFGLLGVGESFGRPSTDGMPNYRESIPELPTPLLGRAEEVGRLRVAMARSPRRIRVWGARGIGKSTVIAAAIRDFENYYERVLWLHGWAAHTKSGILGAIVRALDEHGRCPVDPVDIETRYRELTQAQRVLIVVELMGGRRWDIASVELPAPAFGSLLIEEATTNSPSADATFEIGPLSTDHARALWARWTSLPMTRRHIELTAGRPSIIEFVAQIWNADAKVRGSNWLRRFRRPWSDCVEIFHELDHPLPYEIEQWSYFARALPRRYLDEDLAKWQARGILRLDGEIVRLTGRADDSFHFGYRAEFLEAVAEMEPPLTPLELEFERRGLRLYTRHWPVDDNIDDHKRWIRDWREAPEALAQRALESLPVDERPVFAAALSEVRGADEAFAWTRRAITTAIASGQLDRARRLLSNALESLARESLTPIWLADTQLVLALMPPAQFDDAGIAKLLFEWDPEFDRAHPDAAALARIRYKLSSGGDVEPPAIRAFADSLIQHPTLDLDVHTGEMAARFDEFAKQSLYPALYDHFAHAHLCLLALRRGRWAEAKHHLDLVIDTAQGWELAYPLLRARLLTLEFALATGNLEPTTFELDAIMARCEQLLGPLHSGTLAAFTLALRIHDRLGQLHMARSIADDCRRRLRYANPDQTIISHLLEFFTEHGPAEAAASLRARIVLM